MKYNFDMIFPIIEDQKMVAEHYMKEISTWFSTLWRLKTWLQSTME